MKIVHVLPALTKGGGERVAADLANHAANAGHDVTILAAFPVDPTLLRDALKAGIGVRYISPQAGSRVRRYLDAPSWVWRNWEWLSSQDILHCHLTFGAAFASLVRFVRGAGGYRGPLIIETYHAVGVPISRMKRWFHSRLAARRDALVLMAEDEYWNSFTSKRPQLFSRVIPNGVAAYAGMADAAERIAYRREIGIPDECTPVIGTVGRLRPERQPHLYIPIFAKIAQAFPKAHFLIAGDGPELRKIKGFIIEHRLDGRVHLPGLVMSARLPSSILDLYVTINVGPITGIAALEAIFAGTPVVAVQLRDDYKRSPSDWIWSSRDLAEVADYAIDLLRAPEKLRVLARKQHAYAEANHTAEAMGKAYADVYETILERSPTSDQALH